MECTLSPEEFDLDSKRELGHGTFGTTYQVFWRTKCGNYCVKCIPLQGTDKFADYYRIFLLTMYTLRTNLAHIQKECLMLQAIDTVHVIQYFGSFIYNNTYCIVTELATSGDLRAIITVCVNFLH